MFFEAIQLVYLSRLFRALSISPLEVLSSIGNRHVAGTSCVAVPLDTVQASLSRRAVITKADTQQLVASLRSEYITHVILWTIIVTYTAQQLVPAFDIRRILL